MRIFNPDSAAHWYYPDGRPCHDQPMKTRPGEMRATTVGDARKLGLLPSVTNIINVIDRPELTAWKQSQAVLAALTLPRHPLEGDDDFAERVARDAKEQVTEAAIRGQKLHAATEEYLLFGRIAPCQTVAALFEPFPAWADKNILNVEWCERTLVGRGYAGRVDLKAEFREVGWGIGDFKSRKPFKGKFSGYISDDLQLSAYQRADGDLSTARVSIFINSLEPAEPHLHVWPKEQDDDAFEAFQGAFRVWCYNKQYNPLAL